MSTQFEYSPDADRIMSVSLGPQHPGAGHFRIRLWLDGDYVVKAEPDPGYVHRGEEKMGEYRNYIQNVPHLERPVILDSCGILFPYALAVDELMKNKIPPRGEYLRIIMAEINRIVSHMYFIGIYGIFVGHTTMITWAMGDRDFWIDIAERIGGARVTFAYIIPGGVRNDMPEGLTERALKTCDWFEKRMNEYEKIFFKNPLCWARAYVALQEMRQSVKIIRQAFKKIPAGPVRLKLGPQPRVPAGEVYARSEAARGEMSYHLISDGTPGPDRMKIGVPSF